jgi:hypothetical protein
LLDGDGVADEPDRGVADDDLAAGGTRFQPLRNDDGVARCEGVAVCRVAGEDLAGVDPGANVDSGAVEAFELVVQAAELSTKLDGRAHGAQRIVLVDDRDPEDGEDGVADELLDRAPVSLEHLARGLVVARPDAPQRLGVEPLAERGRVGHVAEDERDGLPDHETSLGRL